MEGEEEVKLMEYSNGKWSKEEDERLMQAVTKKKLRQWKEVSEFMKTRSPAQCCQRWIRVLHPSIRKGPWTKEELRALERGVKKYGVRKWKSVAREVPGRTDLMCRGKWYSLKGRELRGVEKRYSLGDLREFVGGSKVKTGGKAPESKRREWDEEIESEVRAGRQVPIDTAYIRQYQHPLVGMEVAFPLSYTVQSEIPNPFQLSLPFTHKGSLPFTHKGTYEMQQLSSAGSGRSSLPPLRYILGRELDIGREKPESSTVQNSFYSYIYS